MDELVAGQGLQLFFLLGGGNGLCGYDGGGK
jgi:hypothetical protein